MNGSICVIRDPETTHVEIKGSFYSVREMFIALCRALNAEGIDVGLLMDFVFRAYFNADLGD